MSVASQITSFDCHLGGGGKYFLKRNNRNEIVGSFKKNANPDWFISSNDETRAP